MKERVRVLNHGIPISNEAVLGYAVGSISEDAVVVLKYFPDGMATPLVRGTAP